MKKRVSWKKDEDLIKNLKFLEIKKEMKTKNGTEVEKEKKIESKLEKNFVIGIIFNF